jgi:hypothetical protein
VAWKRRAAAVALGGLVGAKGALAFELTSPAFPAGGTIPVKHTCDGDDVSPPLAWSGVPDGTKAFVLVVDDPDAPDPAAPKVRWVHWVLVDLPPAARALPAGAGGGTGLPAGTVQGLNDWGRRDYGGPCPPVGRHRYVHALYALDRPVGTLAKPTRAAVEQAMAGHVLGRAELVGTYERAR